MLPKAKRTRVRIESTFQYIQLLNGVFSLTDTEIKVLAAFIDVHEAVTHAGIDINVFSTEMKKKVAKKLHREDFNTLNNYIKAIHDKKAIKRCEEGYTIQPLLIPNNDEYIILKLEWTKKN